MRRGYKRARRTFKRVSRRSSCSNILNLWVDHNIPSTQYIGDHIKYDPKTIYEDIYVNGVLSLNPECHKYFMIELEAVHPELYKAIQQSKECRRVNALRREILRDYSLTIDGRKMVDENGVPLPINPDTKWISLGESSNPLKQCWDELYGPFNEGSGCPSCDEE